MFEAIIISGVKNTGYDYNVPPSEYRVVETIS